MARGSFSPFAGTLPRAHEPRPQGFGTNFLWSGQRENSRSEALVRILMPKEWRRVENLRRARRERLLRDAAVSDSATGVVPATDASATAEIPATAAAEGAEGVVAAGNEPQPEPCGHSNENDEAGGANNQDDSHDNEAEAAAPAAETSEDNNNNVTETQLTASLPPSQPLPTT